MKLLGKSILQSIITTHLSTVTDCIKVLPSFPDNRKSPECTYKAQHFKSQYIVCFLKNMFTYFTYLFIRLESFPILHLNAQFKLYPWLAVLNIWSEKDNYFFLNLELILQNLDFNFTEISVGVIRLDKDRSFKWRIRAQTLSWTFHLFGLLLTTLENECT